MNRSDAKQVQNKFSEPHKYKEALKHFSSEQLNKLLDLLDDYQVLLGSEIADYSLDLVHDLLDDETPQIVRSYWFSRGTRDYYLCIDGTGLVRSLDPQMPTRLFNQIFEILESFYDQS
jgi:hypothetical protein